MYGKLLQILSAQWLIHGETAMSYLPVLVSILRGAKINEADFKDEFAPKAYVTDATLVDQWDLQDGNVPMNSVAILPICGVMTTDKTIRLINNVRMVKANPNISSVVFRTNTPGGMVDKIDMASAEIKSLTIPKLSVIEGIDASAGMWITSACDKRIATSLLDRIGSIGVMTSSMNFEPLLKKLGIESKDFYATKSTNKNNSSRQLAEGNEQPIIDELDYVNELFHKTIMDNMGIAADSEVLKGDIYYTEEAIKMGLVDQLMSFDDAIQLAIQMGAKSNINNYFNKQTKP